MRKSLTIASMIFAMAALAGPVRADGTQMTGEELLALLGSGKTIGLGGPEVSYAGELELMGDGTGKGVAQTHDGKKSFTLTGTWKIVDDEFCRTWAEFNDGLEVCERWVRTGPNKVEVFVGEKKLGVNHWQ